MKAKPYGAETNSKPVFTCSKLIVERYNKVWIMFKVTSKDTRTIWRRFCVFIVNFEYILHLVLVFLLLTLNMWLPAGLMHLHIFCNKNIAFFKKHFIFSLYATWLWSSGKNGHMCQRTPVESHAYADKSRRTYLRDVHQLLSPEVNWYVNWSLWINLPDNFNNLKMSLPTVV